jgi:hypothetical protein
VIQIYNVGPCHKGTLYGVRKGLKLEMEFLCKTYVFPCFMSTLSRLLDINYYAYISIKGSTSGISIAFENQGSFDAC